MTPTMKAAKRRLAVFIALSVLLASCASGPSFERDVVVVDFDDHSESILGRKFDREYIAAVTEKLFSAKVSAVVIKVFLDLPADEFVDARLERAMKRGRVILQASMNTEPPVSSDLDTRFEYRGRVEGVRAGIDGAAGWLPIRRFQNAAAKVCFADVRVVTNVPVVEKLGDRLYKTLYICILEEAIGKELASVGPSFVTIGPWRAPVTQDADIEIALTNPAFPRRVPAETVISEETALDLAGKIAIVTYSGSKSPTLMVRGQAIAVHQVFLAVLRDVFSAGHEIDR